QRDRGQGGAGGGGAGGGAGGGGALGVGAKPSGGVPIGAFVFGGIGVAALAVGTFFLLQASGDASSLRGSCAPACSHDDVNSARSKAVVADVAFGAGAVALIAAAWMVLVRPSAAPQAQTGLSLDLAPTPGGASGSVRGAF